MNAADRLKEFSRKTGAAQAALAGLGTDCVAVPVVQLEDIYARFLRLTKLGQSEIQEWIAMGEMERSLRRAVFEQSDFGALFAGQWLSKESCAKVRALVKAECDRAVATANS